MFRMRWVGNDFQQVVITMNATTIFRRAGIRSREADRMFEGRIRRQNLFGQDLVLPAVAEIVLVSELPLRCRG
jgi:hypothetical protein